VTRREPRSDRPPDVEIGASAKARKLRFRRKPKTRVEFESRTRVRSDDRIEDIEVESESGSKRRNLPDEVEPGVTYRDVEVGWAARARLRMPERLEGDSKDELSRGRKKRLKRPRSS
jgi:hypothetical protein